MVGLIIKEKEKAVAHLSTVFAAQHLVILHYTGRCIDRMAHSSENVMAIMEWLVLVFVYIALTSANKAVPIEFLLQEYSV